MFYIKREKPIEAICFTGDNKEEIWSHWKYIKFAENINGEIEGLVPTYNNVTEILNIGDFLVVGDNNEAIIKRKTDFLYEYEPFVENDTRVNLNCNIEELDKNAIYLVEVIIPKSYDTSVIKQKLNAAKSLFDESNINAVFVPSETINKLNPLQKNTTYLLEINDSKMNEKVLNYLLTELSALDISIVVKENDNSELTKLFYLM